MSLPLLCCLDWCFIPVKMVAIKYKLARSANGRFSRGRFSRLELEL